MFKGLNSNLITNLSARVPTQHRRKLKTLSCPDVGTVHSLALYNHRKVCLAFCTYFPRENQKNELCQKVSVESDVISKSK